MDIINLIMTLALLNNVDPKLALSIAKTESKLNVNAIGKLGEVGLFQIRPEYYKRYTMKELYNPIINVTLGIKHLKKSMTNCKFKDKFESVLCYNVGVTGANKIKHPSLHKYVKEVKRNYYDL